VVDVRQDHGRHKIEKTVLLRRARTREEHRAPAQGVLDVELTFSIWRSVVMQPIFGLEVPSGPTRRPRPGLEELGNGRTPVPGRRSARRSAGLPRVGHPGPDRPRRRPVEIRVLEDDHRSLPPSSRTSGVSVSAAFRMRSLPTGVEPVKKSLSTPPSSNASPGACRGD